jgi:hypothetical protein
MAEVVERDRRAIVVLEGSPEPRPLPGFVSGVVEATLLLGVALVVVVTRRRKLRP